MRVTKNQESTAVRCGLSSTFGHELCLHSLSRLQHARPCVGSRVCGETAAFLGGSGMRVVLFPAHTCVTENELLKYSISLSPNLPCLSYFCARGFCRRSTARCRATRRRSSRCEGTTSGRSRSKSGRGC